MILDELREHRDDGVWSAALPTQNVARNPQIWAVSNAGDPDSVVLNQLRDRGRAAARNPDGDPSIAYFEWSAPEGADLNDLDALAQANPSMGYTVSAERLLGRVASMSEAGARTEILCQWVDHAADAAVPSHSWRACADSDLEELRPDDEGSCWMALDLDPNRTVGVLILAKMTDDKLIVEPVEWWSNPSEDDVVERVLAWIELWTPQAIGYDPYSVRGVAERIGARTTTPMESITGTAWYSACSSLWDVVTQGKLAHPDDPLLNEAVAAAARKDVADGAWYISRRWSGSSITGCVALARAVHLAVSAPPSPTMFFIS